MTLFKTILLTFIGINFLFSGVFAQNSHPAITDPTGFDPAYPPTMEELSFISGGHKINGHIYIAAGEGPHPTVIMLHGFAGNEKNLDIAQALRRSGINSLFIHYRGAWGSGGEFMIPNAVGDVGNIISNLTDPKWAKKRRVDTKKIGLLGHSFGGLIGTLATVENKEVQCYVFKAGWNAGLRASLINSNPETKTVVIEGISKDIRKIGGPLYGDAEAYVNDLALNADYYNISNHVGELNTRKLLVIGGLKDMALPIDEHHRPFVKALREAGAKNMTELIIDDDHSFSGSRIKLSIAVVDWFQNKCWN